MGKSVENFRALCTGEKGCTKEGKPLHYKNCVFHRIYPGFKLEGGDIVEGDGTGGESIYGESFDARPDFRRPVIKHDKPGVLSMLTSGEGMVRSQFFITFADTPHLNFKHC